VPVMWASICATRGLLGPDAEGTITRRAGGTDQRSGAL
jgi:hypothetical protein